MGKNPSHFSSCGDDCPVESVSWHDAVTFCNKLSERDGLRAAYRIHGEKVTWDRSANGYRLPTEAEWECACRAGTETAFSSGGISETGCDDRNLDRIGWYCGNASKKTHGVARKESNTWGPHDMHGNVWEWCWDWRGDYPSRSVTDPAGPDRGSDRVHRGGSWRGGARVCRSAYRFGLVPGIRSRLLGLRLARSAE